MKHIHIFAFQRPFWKKQKKLKKTHLPQNNLEHVVKYSTYDSKNSIKVEELSHTKLVFAV